MSTEEEVWVPVTLRSLLSCHFFIGPRPYDQALAFCEKHGYDPQTPVTLVERKP